MKLLQNNSMSATVLDKYMRDLIVYGGALTYIDEWKYPAFKSNPYYSNKKDLMNYASNICCGPSTTATAAKTSEDAEAEAARLKKLEEKKAAQKAHQEKLDAKAEARKSHPEKLRAHALEMTRQTLDKARALRDYLATNAGCTVNYVTGCTVGTTDHEMDESYAKAHYSKEPEAPSTLELAKRDVYAKFGAVYFKALADLASDLEALAITNITNKKA